MKFTKKPDKSKDGATAILKKPKIVRALGKIFYAAFFLIVSYLLVMGVGMAIPIGLSYVFRSFGYTLETIGEAFLGGAAALFFLAWIFVITFFAVRALWKFFHKQIKKLDE